MYTVRNKGSVLLDKIRLEKLVMDVVFELLLADSGVPVSRTLSVFALKRCVV